MIKEFDMPIGKKPIENSLLGTLPGTLTHLAQAPKHLAELPFGGYNLLRSIAKHASGEEPILPEVPQGVFNFIEGLYPNAKQLQQKIGIDRSGYWENLADRSIAGGTELALLGIPRSLRAFATGLGKTLPISTAGEVASDLAAPFGPTTQTIAQLGTMAATPYALKGLGKAVSKIPGMATEFGRKELEKTIPLGREFNKAASAEEREAIKQIKEYEKKVAQGEKVSAKEEALNRKNLERFRAENLTSRQEELDLVDLQEASVKERLKELELQKKNLERFRAENLTGESKLDADVLKRRELNKANIDKFQAENNDIMSKQDAARFKAEIDAGQESRLPEYLESEIEKQRKNLIDISGYKQDLRSLEDIVSETFGANQEQLRQRVRNLYNEFRESYDPNLETSAKKLKILNKTLTDSIAEGIPTESKKTISDQIIKPIENIIQNGKIKVRDVTALRADINETIRAIYKKNGSLERYEKNLPQFNRIIDSMLEDVALENPGMKMSSFKEANRLRRNLSQTSDIARWAHDVIQAGDLKGLKWIMKKTGARGINSVAVFANNPQIKKYIGNAVKDFTKGEFRKATKNLIAANERASKALSEAEVNPELSVLKNTVSAPMAQIGKVIEF